MEDESVRLIDLFLSESLEKLKNGEVNCLPEIERDLQTLISKICNLQNGGQI